MLQLKFSDLEIQHSLCWLLVQCWAQWTGTLLVWQFKFKWDRESSPQARVLDKSFPLLFLSFPLHRVRSRLNLLSLGCVMGRRFDEFYWFSCWFLHIPLHTPLRITKLLNKVTLLSWHVFVGRLACIFCQFLDVNPLWFLLVMNSIQWMFVRLYSSLSMLTVYRIHGLYFWQPLQDSILRF